jgi:hypothetical protein
MSDNEEAKEAIPAEQPAERVYPRVDPLLVDLIELANKAERGRFALSLIVGGTTITGVLIGSREYFKRYGELLASTITDPVVQDRVRTRWITQGEVARNTILKDMEESDKRGMYAHISYIHLRDCRVISGGQLVPAQGGLLVRFRLTEVQGFSPQTLGIVGSEP